MGQPPSLQHTLDRVDPSGNYSKENCRWADHDQHYQHQRIRRSGKGSLGIAGISLNKGKFLLRRGTGETRETLYNGYDYFEACCRARSWENVEQRHKLAMIKASKQQ